MGGIRVSMITPSSGRAALLLQKLDAIARIDMPPQSLEVVLIDNDCPQGVGDQATAHMRAQPRPFTLTVLRSSTRLTAAQARTWGAREARGELLWWSDDDVLPLPGALKAHLNAQRVPACVTVGPVRYLHAGGSMSERVQRVGPAQLTGANSVMPRAAYLAIADTLPQLPKPYGGEDALVGCALQAHGLSFAAAHDAWVEHHGTLPGIHSGDATRGHDAGFNAATIAQHYPRAAWALGVHPVSMLAKAFAFAPAWCALTTRSPRMRFEHAFYQGARAAHHAATDTP